MLLERDSALRRHPHDQSRPRAHLLPSVPAAHTQMMRPIVPPSSRWIQKKTTKLRRLNPLIISANQNRE